MSVELQASLVNGSHRDGVMVLRTTREGRFVLSGSRDNTVKLWSTQRGMLVTSFKGQGHEVYDVDVADSNAVFVSAGADKAATIWDVQTGEVLRKFRGHALRINAVRYARAAPTLSGAADGANLNPEAVLLTAGADRIVNMWDLRSGNDTKPICTLTNFKDSVSDIAVTTGGNNATALIVTACVDGVLRIFDIRKGQLRCDTLGPPLTFLNIAIDCKHALVSTLANRLKFVSLTTANAQDVLLKEYQGGISSRFKVANCIAPFDGCKFVFSGSEDSSILCWNSMTTQLVKGSKISTSSGSPLVALCHHPTERKLFSGSLDGSIVFWTYTESV